MKESSSSLEKVKVKPPFASLSSFHIAAVILSYSGFVDEVKGLLYSLSRNTRLFAVEHSDVLAGFLIEWNPSISEVIEFGDTNKEWTDFYPSKE